MTSHDKPATTAAELRRGCNLHTAQSLAIERCSGTGLILTYFVSVYCLSFLLCLYQFCFTVLTCRLVHFLFLFVCFTFASVNRLRYFCWAIFFSYFILPFTFQSLLFRFDFPPLCYCFSFCDFVINSTAVL